MKSVSLMTRLGLLSAVGLHVAVWLLWYVDISFGEIQEEAEGTQGDYCLFETFQPLCTKNEVILMKSATLGRMRIGRCITAEEIDKLRSHYLGCSEDLLPFFDRKCSGQTNCEISHNDISAENNNPCPPGLNIYLEVSYDCIGIVDARRSCVVDATTNPIHITSSTSCGSNSEPWIVEAPVGQRLSIGIIDFTASDSSRTQDNRRQPCRNCGFVVDKAGKTNVSICVGGTRREKKLYSSAGNLLNIFLTYPEQKENSENKPQFILRIQAVGCSNIIPPVDGYAKRNGDAIMIGCYASRKTWYLNCEDGKWVGVIGNCSQGVHVGLMEQVAESEPIAIHLNNEQVFAFVATAGFTCAICLAIVCLGVVYMRRFRLKGKTKRDCKTLIPNCNFSSAAGSQTINNRVRCVGQDLSGNNIRDLDSQELPTYSVFVGDGEFNDVTNNISVENNHR